MFFFVCLFLVLRKLIDFNIVLVMLKSKTYNSVNLILT